MLLTRCQRLARRDGVQTYMIFAPTAHYARGTGKAQRRHLVGTCASDLGGELAVGGRPHAERAIIGAARHGVLPSGAMELPSQALSARSGEP